MNTLELRKLILVGFSTADPQGASVLDQDGLPANPRLQPVVVRIVFWIPARPPFQRCDGETEVINALPFEVQALRDGAIVEHVQEFTFPEQPSKDEMRRRLMPVWEGLALESLGHVPNGVPLEERANIAVQFTPVSQ